MHRVVEEIQENNKWRYSEFAKFKANQNDVEVIFWNRMCIPMIYAHWEGFVVDALKIMLGYLNELKLTHSELPIRLVVLSLGDNYRTLSGKQSFTQRIEFTEKFKNLLDSVIRFQTKVETKSNLKGKVFKELCDIFGFDTKSYNEFLPDIDRLVNIRNSIAHGENSFLPSSDNINLYINSVQNACDLLVEDIDKFLVEKKFLVNAE